MEELCKTRSIILKHSVLVLVTLLCIVTKIKAQVMWGEEIPLSPGIYTTENISHQSPQHYEKIVLNEDHTFTYYLRSHGFIKYEFSGQWERDHNVLILNELPKPKSSVIVKERYNPKLAAGLVEFIVYLQDGGNFNYSISAISGDTTITMKNQSIHTIIPLTTLDSFVLSTGIFTYPEYKVTKSKANRFHISASTRKRFINERWLILDQDRIRPMGPKQEYAYYWLSKEE